ncbi:MAG: hypothetical protein J0H49_29075 [Acidobacteria bacterium]|nr:hypothetical protein [Acidobacteriota bacterium]
MSSLIAKQPKDTRKQTTVSLSGSVLADLELYCQFIDSARDWVINEALKAIFRRDKAFLAWKERERGPELQKTPESAAPQSGQAHLSAAPTGRADRARAHRPETAPAPPAA